MPFLPQILESQLNDFVRAMARKTSPDLTDVINISHPILDQIRAAGGVKSENPGQGPVRDIRYALARRTKRMSRTKQNFEREKAGKQTTTTAQFNWFMYTTTMYVNKFLYHNTLGGDAQVSYLKEMMDERDIDMQNQLVEDIWGGFTEGSTPFWGIQDFVQFDSSSDPARGAVGGISVADVPTWRNVSSNFNGAYATYSSGAQTQTFLDTGVNSLGSTYRACCNNLDSKNDKGCPKLLPANEPFIRYCEGLARAGLLRQDGNETRDFGIEGFRYKKGVIYWDNDCPDNPGDNSKGVAFLLNTHAMEVVYAKGLERMAGDKMTESEDGSYTWDVTTQCTMTIKDRRRCGVIYGIGEAAAA